MEYLKIKNWEKWQTYRNDRGQPPWIKVHRRIRLNPEWVELSDSERGQLIAMWLLAADKEGVIPASPKMIQKLCFMTDPPDINKFIELDFICQNGVNVASTWRQDDVPKAEAKAKAEADKKRFVPPSLEDVLKYFDEKGYSQEVAQRAFEFYDTNDWIDSNDKKVKNWKQKMLAVWFKPENKKAKECKTPVWY